MMKKFLFSLALFTLCANVSNAQAPASKPGSWKAYDKIQKADNLMGQRNSEAFEQAQAMYAEAEKILKEETAKAEAEQKNDKLALLYLQSGQLQDKLFNVVLNNAQQGLPFDTLQFCQRVDNIIGFYNAAAAYNHKPNAKGKVKADPYVDQYCKLRSLGVTTLYYNCGAFMDAMGKKQESVDYFQKFVEMPSKSAVFSPAEVDSIYKAGAKIYSTARFNLALQNYHLKNWDKAIACCDEALKDTVGIHDLYLIKINAYGEMKDSAAWQRTLVEASQRTGKASYMQNLMYYYMQNKKIDEATTLANKLTADYPNDKMAWFMKGAIELNVKSDYAQARESFGKALAIDPDFEEALFNMGTCYINDIYDQRQSGKFKYIGTNRRIEGKGEAAYKKEKAIYDKELATVKEYYEKARPYLEHLRELTPNDAKRWASPLQMVYSSLEMKEKAQEMDQLLEEANRQ